jgi:hypothetical protein
MHQKHPPAKVAFSSVAAEEVAEGATVNAQTSRKTVKELFNTSYSRSWEVFVFIGTLYSPTPLDVDFFLKRGWKGSV